MSRPLRILGSGLIYHVTARGNGRMAIFLDDTDRLRFAERLATVVTEKHLVCHADCQMVNHYHAVITTSLPNLSNAIRQLNGDYARWWNHRHRHVGHLFQGRFGAQIVQDDAYLLTVCRYVVLNPVRAGLVAEPGQWRWSSYRATAGLAPTAEYLSPETLWHCLGGDVDGPERYRAFVAAGGTAGELPPDPILGDESFRRRFDQQRESASREVPARERRPGPPIETLFVEAVTRSSRNAAILRAVASGYSLREIAAYLGVHPCTIKRVTVAEGAAGCQSSKMQSF
jgi:putative transposase